MRLVIVGDVGHRSLVVGLSLLLPSSMARMAPTKMKRTTKREPLDAAGDVGLSTMLLLRRADVVLAAVEAVAAAVEGLEVAPMSPRDLTTDPDGLNVTGMST